MKPLLYIMKKSFKNYLKELKKKPAALIAYIIAALFIIFIIVYSFMAPSSNLKNLSINTYGTIISATLLIFLYFNIKQGVSRGSSFFRFSDVNLVFTAPIPPAKVLIYGFIKQLYTTFIALMFMVFQIPNLKNMFPLKIYGPIIIIAGLFLFFFSLSIIGVLVYSICSKSKKRRNYFEKGINLVIGIILILFLWKLYITKDVLISAEAILNSKYFSYIPFLGWFKQIFMSAILGINSSFYINLLLIFISIAIIIYVIYKYDVDYYEDVLNATEYKEQLYRLKKEGKSLSDGVIGKVRKVKGGYKGYGVKSIFYRQLLEYRKSGLLFIDKSTIMMIVSGIVFGFFFRDKDGGINSVLYFTVYMLLFMTMQGKWSQEISKPYIFLIPGSSGGKLFYATLADNIKNIIDGLVLFIAAGAMFKESIIIIVLCALSYGSFGAVYIYGDILGRRIFGDHSKNLGMLLKILLTVVLIAPGIIISIVLGIVYGNLVLSKYLSYIVLIVYNIFVSFIILFTNSSIFENLEMK